MALDHLTQMARLVEVNWAAAWATLGAVSGQPRTFVDDTADCLRVYTPDSTETMLNIVMRYAVAGPARLEQLEAAIIPYRQHHLPMQWWLLRGCEPSGLRQELAALGMESWGGAAAMALDLARWRAPAIQPPADVWLTRAVHDDDHQAALDVICEVFYAPVAAMARWTSQNPAFQVYLARLGARPVAALATLYAADVAGVYNVATLHGARRRGIAGALLIQALRDAQGAGCGWATLTATPEARRLYETLGFRACGVIEQWMPGARLNHTLLAGRQPTPYDSPHYFWGG